MPSYLRIGSFQFQPGEIAKLLLIVFLAGYLREKREVLAQGRLKDFGPLLLIWGAAMLVIVMTNDLGSALLRRAPGQGCEEAGPEGVTDAGGLDRGDVLRGSDLERLAVVECAGIAVGRSEHTHAYRKTCRLYRRRCCNPA